MESREKEIYRVTITGTAVNAVLVAIKFVAGIFGHSAALVADAVHSLTDFITDIIVLLFVRISGKPRNEYYGYGHGKFETLATMIIGVILFLTGIGLFVNSLRLIVSCIGGEEAKELLYRYTVREGRRLKSDAVIANAWHHRSDAFSSIGTVAGIGGAMFAGENWRILDPVAAAAVSFFIIKAGYDIVRPAMNELLEGSLPKEQTAELERIISGVNGVKGFHNLRCRKIGSTIAVDVHIKLDGDMRLTDAHDIASAVERAIRSKFGASSMIYIHMEPMKPTR